MGNDDPTTTIPDVASGHPSIGLMIVLALIGTFAFFYGWRKVIGSISRPVHARKALAGGISVGVSFVAFGVLCLTAGQSLWGGLLLAGSVVLFGYACAPVRRAVAGVIHQTKVPPEPPGPVAHV